MFLLSVFLAATSAIGYEILAATALVNLLGSSVFYFSLTIGIYLSALGTGSWYSSRVRDSQPSILRSLIYIESGVAVLGGGLSAVFYWLYGTIINFIRGSELESFKGLIASIGTGEIVFNFLAFGLLFAVGFLVGFELPLFSRFLSHDEKLGKAIDRVFFWDYAGALATSVFLPILFFPMIGILRTSFLIGLLNVAAAVILAAIYRTRFLPENPQKKFLVLAVGLAFLFNAAGLLYAKPLEFFLEQNSFAEGQLLYYQQTPFQRISYVQSPEGVLRLYLSGQLQFESGDWEAAYHEALIHPAFVVKCQMLNIKCGGLNVLVLGGGDGLALREILKYPEVASAKLVDIDGIMVAVAKNRDFIRALNRDSFWNSRVETVIDDAFRFVEKDKETYDLIFVDFPDVHDETLSRLYSKEFYAGVRRRLADGGVAAIQSGAYLSPSHRIIVRTLEAAGFNSALPYQSRRLGANQMFFGFGFTLAGTAVFKPGDFSGRAVSVPARTLVSADLNSMFESQPAFPYAYDYGSDEAEINSIFRPIIFEYQGSIFIQRYFNAVSVGHAIKQSTPIIKAVDSRP